jgi:hypothetical protein
MNNIVNTIFILLVFLFNLYFFIKLSINVHAIYQPTISITTLTHTYLQNHRVNIFIKII